MAKNIQSIADKFPNDIPIIFIGGFHLDGISNLIPDDINYIYLDASAVEDSALNPASPQFQNFRFPDRRQKALADYLESIKHGMKIPVTFAPEEIPAARSISEQLEQNYQRLLNTPDVGRIDAQTRAQIITAIKTNPTLERFNIEFKEEQLHNSTQGVFCKINDNTISIMDDGRFTSANSARIDFLQRVRLKENSDISFLDDSNNLFSVTRTSDGYVMEQKPQTAVNIHLFGNSAHQTHTFIFIKNESHICKN
jgi:hypothetical protein